MNIINIIIITTIIPCCILYTCSILCRVQHIQVELQESSDVQNPENQQESIETYNSVSHV